MSKENKKDTADLLLKLTDVILKYMEDGIPINYLKEDIRDAIDVVGYNDHGMGSKNE